MGGRDPRRGTRTVSEASEALARELYWAGPPIPDPLTSQPSGDDVDLVARWSDLEGSLRFDSSLRLPAEEPFLHHGGGLKRWIKRTMFALLRPLTRRYDRIDADMSALGMETAQQVAATREAVTQDLELLRGTLAELRAEVAAASEQVDALEGLVRRNDRRLGATATDLTALASRFERGAPEMTPPAQPGTASPADDGYGLTDAFYWRFESAMRGTPDEIERKLRAYEGLASRLRDELDGDPLWLDLGCGEGTFLELLRSWGWRVRGMDISPDAVRACTERGFDADVGALPGFLVSYAGEPPGVMSAIQVIEHLAPETWLPTIRFALKGLATDGALLIETINPLNPVALGSAFFGDVTHTWPANPWTVREMATFAGFDDVDVQFLNPDGNDVPQDYALIARKRA
jgi:O-antigen chain-terminating methyltransferase